MPCHRRYHLPLLCDARKMQIHLSESLFELNLTGTLPDEIDVISTVSEFYGTISPVNVEMSFIVKIENGKSGW